MLSRSHKIRMYPNKAQEAQLWCVVGAARFAYNWGLETWENWYNDYKDGKTDKKPSAFGLSNRWTTERPDWAENITRCAQVRAFTNLGLAYTAFWKGLSKQPVFKKRGVCRDSFYIDNTRGALQNKKFRIPNVGWISLAENLRIKGKINGYHISTYGGKWWVSVNVDALPPTKIISNSVVGVDVGLKTPGYASDNTFVSLPTETILKLQKRLKLSQRRLSKKKSKSKNYSKALIRKQKIQQKLNDLRTDLTHKFTTTLTKNHSTVVVETLSIETMIEKAPTKAIRRSYGNSLMYELHRQLKYKANCVIQADRYFPSTKICSQCGNKKDEMPTSLRTYRCSNCGSTLDRDYNAALNLRNFGVGQTLRACGESPSDSVKQEVLL